MPPDLASLPPENRGWPWGWYLSSPETFYVWFMFLISLVLVLPSIVFLRRLAQSTTSLKTLVLQKLHLASADNTRKPRNVWSNPIAWREAKTKASAARASTLRYGFILAGMVGAVILVIMFSHEQLEGSYITPISYDHTPTLGSTPTDKATAPSLPKTSIEPRSTSSRKRKRPSTGWESLTPTELKVVELVAAGLPNREIGAKLFVSLATVKTHLIHVYTKLDVRSRAELASAATSRTIARRDAGPPERRRP